MSDRHRKFLGRLRSCHGSVLIEASATLAFSAAALAAGLGITYASFARFWLDRAAYETSICLSTPATTFNCEQNLRRSTARILPVGQLEDVALSRSKTEVQTHFRWRMNSEFSLKIKDTQKLPLLGPSAKMVIL